MPAAAPGGPSSGAPSDDALAGRWLSTLGALVARAGHELNGALNGAVVNLEVVRLRARPGADAGAAAPFAEVAAGELERSAAMVGALVALTRAPRSGAADVREVLRQIAALLGPAAAQKSVALAVDDGAERMGTTAPLVAVRLGMTATLLAALAAAEAAPAAELAGTDPAVEPARLLRCTLRLDPGPTLRIGGPTGLPTASVDPETVGALRDAGLEVTLEADALVLRCPPA